MSHLRLRFAVAISLLQVTLAASSLLSHFVFHSCNISTYFSLQQSTRIHPCSTSSAVTFSAHPCNISSTFTLATPLPCTISSKLTLHLFTLAVTLPFSLLQYIPHLESPPRHPLQSLLPSPLLSSAISLFSRAK